MTPDKVAPSERSPIGLVFAALLTLFALVAIVGLNSGNDEDHSVVTNEASIAGGTNPTL
jgi:hypothetical protein